jgi:hypothetical protein
MRESSFICRVDFGIPHSLVAINNLMSVMHFEHNSTLSGSEVWTKQSSSSTLPWYNKYTISLGSIFLQHNEQYCISLLRSLFVNIQTHVRTAAFTDPNRLQLDLKCETFLIVTPTIITDAFSNPAHWLSFFDLIAYLEKVHPVILFVLNHLSSSLAPNYQFVSTSIKLIANLDCLLPPGSETSFFYEN